jgi:hypothetical protein
LSPARTFARLAAAISWAWLASSGAALACPSCYGAGSGPMVDAARAGAFLLLGIVFALQAAFVAFFLYLRRRARQTHQRVVDMEWSRWRREYHASWRKA